MPGEVDIPTEEEAHPTLEYGPFITFSIYFPLAEEFEKKEEENSIRQVYVLTVYLGMPRKLPGHRLCRHFQQPVNY